jgi:hypothetical protein
VRVTPIAPTFPAGYRKPKSLVSVNYNKVTIINPETGERKEFEDSIKAFEYKKAIDA